MLRGELADLKETVNTGEVGPQWPRARLSCLLCCFCFSFLVPHTPQCLFYSPDSVGFKSFFSTEPLFMYRFTCCKHLLFWSPQSALPLCGPSLVTVGFSFPTETWLSYNPWWHAQWWHQSWANGRSYHCSVSGSGSGLGVSRRRAAR